MTYSKFNRSSLQSIATTIPGLALGFHDHQISAPPKVQFPSIIKVIMSIQSHGRLTLGGLVIMLSVGAIAGMTTNAEARPFFQASRALAMGDAYTAVGSGFESVYYNPAGITYRSQAQIKPFDLETGVSTSFAGMFNGSLLELGSMSGIFTKLQDNPGKPFSIGVNFLPQFLIKNFSVGLVARGFTQAEYDETAGTADFFSTADVGAYVQYAASLAGGLIKIGVGAKVLDRAELDKTYTEAELTSGGLDFSNQWSEGVGYGLDLGALFTIPVAGLPTIGVAVLDVGHTNFTAKKFLFSSSSAASSRPSAISQKVNVGLSGILKHAREIRSVVSVEAKDVTEISDYGSFRDRFHLGWELDLSRFLKIRAGLNEGRYWTAGVGIEIESVMLEFASYGENISTTGGRTDDRKWVGRYVVAF